VPCARQEVEVEKLAPCLWFDGKAEEAARFYVSIFPRSRIVRILHWGKTGPGKEGSVLTVNFELDGKPFMALDGGPEFKFTPAISLMVPCRDQAEIDRYWKKLGKGGQYLECGWLTDRYGVAWQVFPAVMAEYLDDARPLRRDRVMTAMMKMKKFDLAEIERAARKPAKPVTSAARPTPARGRARAASGGSRTRGPRPRSR
jgi:predicted 3-demethylubiquinone-9 3-methyltransferase (glyoxalase superfamily)